MEKLIFIVSLFLCLGVILAAPSDQSFVVSSTETSNNEGKESGGDNVPHHPIIYQMHITSNVSNRFAKTLIASKVRNGEKAAQETTFTVVLPEKAFISEFIMEIDGKSYKAYVKEKEEAKKIYNQAVASGQSAGHVAVSARDSNKFTVSVNIEPESKVVFLLTYEELLERRNDQYELVINIRPGQIVKDLSVLVNINETRPLKFVKTPSLRSGNEISKNEEKLDPSSDIKIINSTTATVKFNPDTETQRQFAKDLGDKESGGLSGQFVVQYDVERDPHGGEVLLQDGYFVHFFAPTELEPLPKHILFVLDTSGSMGGEKIYQLKDAINSILKEIRAKDIISVVDFGNEVYVWDVTHGNRSEVHYGYEENYEEPFDKLNKLELPSPIPATNKTLEQTKRIVDSLYAEGGTNIIGGLETALYLAKMVQDRPTDKKYQSIMIFLTDGQPNVGIDSTEEITKLVTKLNNKNNHIPIFSLSFGAGADKDFLRKLSLKNLGFSRHIYEASDASLQLQEFYKQISSPLLSDITFKYNDAINITKSKFPVYFRGSEIVVTGRYNVSDSNIHLPEPVACWDISGQKDLKPVVEKPVTSLERLWAYLTVKQTLDERELSDNKKELTQKALDLALKYSFVTDVTSLVVVKPNETSSVSTEDASRDGDSDYLLRGSAFTGFSPKYGFYSTVRGGSYLRGGPARHYTLSAVSPISNYDTFDTYDMLAPVDHHVQPLSGHVTINSVVTTSKPALLDILPWLASVLNPNGTITVAQNAYQLGDSAVTIPQVECAQTPLNATETGTCSLLSDCPEVHSHLTDFPVYQKYFCAINNVYAGVCCPKKNPVQPF